MDFPLVHLDFFGNRMLIAVIAIIHVLINHAVAVGFIPLITLLEYLGYTKKESSPDTSKKIDDVARKLMFVGFVLTTTMGALTGVGIWFSVSLVNPSAIGSLIRVFYGAWFTEWIVFVLEVVFVMMYYLSWKSSGDTEQKKKKHILFGVFLSLFSWFTMAIIVAILSFMMDTGIWQFDNSFLSGFSNPLYLPQLYFRTPLAMIMGGAFGLMLIKIYTEKGSEPRKQAVSFTSLWLLIWTPVCAVGAAVYYLSIPEAMTGNLPVAIGTIAFASWYSFLLKIAVIAITISLLVALTGFLKPSWLPAPALLIPILILAFMLGTFERVREFARKPFVIGDYMYANGLRTEDYPLYKAEGILPFAIYSKHSTVTENNLVEAGQDVFMIACSRCHTVNGINSVGEKFIKMLPAGSTLSVDFMTNYIRKMHNVRYFMPPFPGNEKELNALGHFILKTTKENVQLTGVQNRGISGFKQSYTPLNETNKE